MGRIPALKIGRILWDQESAVWNQESLETDSWTATRLDFLSRQEPEPVLDQCSEVGKMLHGLMRSLRRGRS